MSESTNDQPQEAKLSGITISGGATPEEIAAIMVLLSASGGSDDSQASTRRPRSLWNSRARAARPRLSPGPFAWQGSAMPR